jgi:hypothetical protein
VHHGLRQLGEARDVQNRQRRLLHQRERPLRDMCGQVAHTFQVVIDFDGCGQEAHVSRHGLVQRHQAHGEIVDLDLQGVDIGLAFQHLARARRVPVDQRADAVVEGRFYLPTHFQQPGLQILELPIEAAQNILVTKL